MKREKVYFGDFSIDCVSRAQLVSEALVDCRNNSPARLVFDANGHALSLARTDESYLRSIREADLVHADGGYLVTLSKLLNTPSIPERSATTDMIRDFSEAFSKTNYGFYLLGGTKRVNSQCADILVDEYPGLKITGQRDGYFSQSEEEAIVDEINRSGASILWVGLGKPKEQEFCVKWRHKLKPSWIITCGGCYNYVTGDYGRAPNWMQDANIEWIYRMFSEPRKLLWRYLITTPHALYLALRYNGRVEQTSSV